MRPNNGTLLPSVEATALDGNKLSLPDAAIGNWTTVLFYRGHW